ncbi:MAG: nuclear transport factor 2 family protein [Flavobacteriaceae bacterium]|nr:nuclear transport factor 2 family protein [Flavobacteriaceae bacterium]
MRNLMYIVVVAILFAGCQQAEEKRYYAESAEIETLKAGIAAYEAADWDKWRSHFADTAKIYVNSTEAVSVDERVEGLKGMSAAMSSYGFDREDDHIEMVLDKKDQTWVYYWATHKGTIAATNKSLAIPVHLAVRFVDGKIVTEHVYFDATAMNAEFEAIAAAAEAEAETEAEN